jgi:hypothetical protein
MLLLRDWQSTSAGSWVSNFRKNSLGACSLTQVILMLLLDIISACPSSVRSDTNFQFLCCSRDVIPFRLSTAGRRVLEAYTMLFLHSMGPKADANWAASAERILSTHSFGQHIAPRWQLAKHIRWTPPTPNGGFGKSETIGLYKVAGTAVEAIVGAVFHQFVRILFDGRHLTPT